MTTRRCTAKTKKGARCKASPLKDRDVCLAHADATTRESTGFVAANGKAGRKPLPRPDAVARRLIEENIVAVLRPHFRTLGYDVQIADTGPRLVEIDGGGAKLFGESKDGIINVSSYDDLGAMIAASEKLQDRVYGRPKQTQEITGADGGPIELEAPMDAGDRSARAALLLAERGLVPVGGSGNGNGNGNGHHG